jgi:RimJ/RimL family protein N-acetyltransferase
MLSQTIRPATERDILAISTLVLSGSLDGTGIEGTAEELDDWRQENASTALVRARLSENTTLLLVSEGRNESESIGLYGTGYAAMTSGGEAYIGGIYCGVRRKGVGSAIVEELVHWLISKDIKVIEMTIAQHNYIMKKIAEKFGFTKEGELSSDRFYKHGTFEMWFLRR